MSTHVSSTTRTLRGRGQKGPARYLKLIKKNYKKII